ncbi:MAG: hypothetical protein QHH04_09510 [Methanolinea sp.]|jgi:hypothetical protein|nr:hypothetical protein [Methanolinea sp.]
MAQVSGQPEEIRWTAKVWPLYAADFVVSSRGVGQSASKSTKKLNTGLAIGGILTGSPTAVGAGMIVKGREDQSIEWNEVRSITVDHRKRTITVRRKSLVFPIRLYCTEENFGEVLSMVRRFAPPGTLRE